MVSVSMTIFSPGANRAASRDPVRQHTRRCHHQEGRARIALAGMADQRQRLHRLAQAHVVGEDPAQAVVVQRCQPGEPVVLVRTKLGFQRARHGDRVEGLQRPQPATWRFHSLA